MEFVKTDTSLIEEELLRSYETIAGEKLYPANPVRLILETVAYAITLLKNDINYTGKQNLLAYAEGEHLDKLGELLGVKRLPATSAVVSLEFFVNEPLDFDVVIPKGTRVTPDNKLFFETVEDARIPATKKSVVVQARCLTSGTAGNGFLPGQINQLVDMIPYIDGVSNISTSMGGTDIESDEHLRERIRFAPESFSNAGSEGAYIFHTKSAYQEIEDVSVFSPAPGVVNVVFLLKGGILPGDDIVKTVKDYLSSEKVRPLTDKVEVFAPEIVNYDIDLTYFVHKDYSSVVSSIQSAVSLAVDKFVAFERTKIGRDILPDELIKMLKEIDGVYRVDIKSPTYKQIEKTQVAIASSITINYGGIVDD